MKLIVPFLLIFLFACKGNDLPDDVLPKEKMEKVLWEMLQADEWAYHQHPADSIARKKTALLYYAKVYQLNDIDAAVYKKSFDYYCNRPQLLSPVLDSVRKKESPPPSVDPVNAKPKKIFRPA